MKNWCVFLATCLLCGCLGDSKPSQSNDLQIAAQAEWAYACSQLGVKLDDHIRSETGFDDHESQSVIGNPNNTPGPPLADESADVDNGRVSSERPVICAYAPAWSDGSREFLEWYNSPDNNPDKLTGFKLEIVPDDQIPEGLTQYPAFTYGDKGTLGWTDIETLQAELLGDSDGTP